MDLYCRQCGSVMGGSKCPDCGWTQDEDTTQVVDGSRKPVIDDLLQDMVRLAKRYRRQEFTVQNAQSFFKVLKPCAPEESPKRIQKDGKKFWRWRYHERVMYSLRHWFELSEDDKRIVLDARKIGLWWAGDHMLVFRQMVKERQANPDKSKEQVAIEGARRLAQTIRENQGFPEPEKPKEKAAPRGGGKSQRVVKVEERDNEGASRHMYPSIWVAVLECGHVVNCGLSEDHARKHKFMNCKECA